jgi:aspartyl-tRNA(Asn)/glutamyl-tRNA(Gln) amidotransferase subunit A
MRTPHESIRELTEACRNDPGATLDRAQKARSRAIALNDDLHAFIQIADDPATSTALVNGMLAGVAVSIKDNINVAGFTTTCGSSFIRHQPVADPSMIDRIRTAGAYILGKTNLGEFALNATSNNPFFGAVVNPLDHRRTPGGSSGGAGAAIAAGIGDIAIGTDSAGSVRIPAACCGIAGFRPTANLWGLDGIEGAAWSIDSFGVIARTVDDVWFFVNALGMFDAEGATVDRRDPKRVRVAYLGDESMGPAQPSVWARYYAAIDCLRDAGYDCRAVTLSGFGDAPYACAVIAYSEVASTHRQALRADPTRYGDAIRPLFYLGEAFSAQDYLVAQAARPIFGKRFATIADGVDVVLTPTMPMTAPVIGEDASIPEEPASLGLFSYIRFTCLANLIDLPSVSMPVGLDEVGMPVGLQLIGGRGPNADHHLLDIAVGIEAAISARMRS